MYSKLNPFLSFQSCDDQNIANKLCNDCDEYLCDDCVKAHKRVKVTKDHVIKDVTLANVDEESGNSAPTKDLLCSVHPVTINDHRHIG
jgi:B-box zinc finger